MGHCTCIHPNLNGTKQLYDMLLKSRIPVGKNEDGDIATLYIIPIYCDVKFCLVYRIVSHIECQM